MNPGSPAPLTGFDVIVPWLIFAGVLYLLLATQRWIHRHLFGVGYLLAKDKSTATLLYYVALAPGVVLHEFSQYLAAGVFGIRSKRFNMVPQAQKDGSLEMGFIELEKIKNPVYAAIVGAAPLVAGMVAVVVISNSLLNLPEFINRMSTADINIMGPAIQTLINRPDSFFWIYILFAVSNAMMPADEDRRGWIFIGIGVAIFIGFMLIIGLGFVLQAWLARPIPDALYSLSTVFGSVLLVNALVMSLVWGIEHLVSRATGQKYEYRPALPAQVSTGAQYRSVFELQLPIPPPPSKVTVRERPAERPTPVERPAERPGLPAGGAGRPEVPVLSPGATEGLPAPAGIPKLPGGATSAPRLTPAAGVDAPRPVFGKPAESPAPATKLPAASISKPAAHIPTPAAKPGSNLPVPSSGAPPPRPVGGPPALARPGGPPATTGRPLPPPVGAPKPGFSPAPKPGGFGAPSRPGQPAKGPFGKRDEDYIDADVIESEDEYIDADVIEEDDKGSKDDDGDVKYVDIDSV